MTLSSSRMRSHAGEQHAVNSCTRASLFLALTYPGSSCFCIFRAKEPVNFPRFASFVMTPVPEPTSCGAVAVGALTARRRVVAKQQSDASCLTRSRRRRRGCEGGGTCAFGCRSNSELSGACGMAVLV